MPDFLKDYGTEAQCKQALEAARWPTGLHCPRCDGVAHYVMRDGRRKVYQCQACRHQASLIAGTVFHGSKLPLTIWFPAIYLISQAKTGLSSLALKRQLGVSYPTAWLMQHKLMQAMATREQRYVLEGKVQVDDAYLGGEHPGGKAGRRPKEVPEFRWINTVLGNLKTSLSGCYHAFAFQKYAARYLAAFSYRFNRRFDLRTLHQRLLIAVATTAPQLLRVLRGGVADVHC